MEPTNTSPVPSQGPVIGIIVVIVVLIVGAFYFFTQFSGMNAPAPAGVTPSEANAFPPTSPSDEQAAIENDLNAEDFSDIDAEFSELDPEFGY
ncbi:MAG TPA: hypothetical protein VJ837_04620 [Candidatus Paceibacterota bacterium]|nr:hypothetical protein [Candidatus Paceibacterota bacterium]